MEDTGHYHFALLKYLLNKDYAVALINPATTDFAPKLNTINIYNVLETLKCHKQYRITAVPRFDLYEQKQLTRHHHNLKEDVNLHSNRL